MSTTDTTPAPAAPVQVRLSCRHVVDLTDDPTAEVNAGNVEIDEKMGCPKCKPKGNGDLSVRRVKDIIRTETVVMDEENGGYKVVDPEPVAIVADAERAAERGDATLRPSADRLMAAVADAVEAPKVESKRAARVVAASTEAKALKAWEETGQRGDRPATPNLDAINAEAAAKEAAADGTKAGAAPVDPANPMNLGVPQGPTGMVDSADMTADDTAPKTKRPRKSRSPEGQVTTLNLSPVRRRVMLAALPEDATDTVGALRSQVAAEADRVSVDAPGVLALLTGLKPLCEANDGGACRLQDWLMRFAEEVGYKG